MKEEYRDIIGYEGHYQVSNLGNVKSLERIVKHHLGGNKILKEKILKSTKYSTGYVRVPLCINGKVTRIGTHRLIAVVFIPNPENKPCVNHINGIKDDNKIENLEWCSYSENNKHAFKLGLNVTVNVKKVINTKTGEIYKSITDAAKTTTHCSQNLCAMLKGKRNNLTSFEYYNPIV